MHNTRALVRNEDIHNTFAQCNIFRNENIVANIRKKLDNVKKVIRIYGCPSKNNELAVRNVLMEYNYGINERALTFQFTQAEMRLHHSIIETTERLKRDLKLRYNDNKFIYRDISGKILNVINDYDRKRIHMILKTINDIEKLIQYIQLNSETFLDNILCKYRVNNDVVKTIYKFVV